MCKKCTGKGFKKAFFVNLGKVNIRFFFISILDHKLNKLPARPKKSWIRHWHCRKWSFPFDIWNLRYLRLGRDICWFKENADPVSVSYNPRLILLPYLFYCIGGAFGLNFVAEKDLKKVLKLCLVRIFFLSLQAPVSFRINRRTDKLISKIII